jgi:small subunit ribosomal protein S14
MDLNKIAKNASPVRLHNRCELTGRPKAFYRKFRISRIALRELASHGQIPGVVKSSW